MKQVFIIGIGAGNPDYITVQAINALNEVDVFYVMDKGREKNDSICEPRRACQGCRAPGGPLTQIKISSSLPR
jgi:precorrin-6A synthase